MVLDIMKINVELQNIVGKAKADLTALAADVAKTIHDTTGVEQVVVPLEGEAQAVVNALTGAVADSRGGGLDFNALVALVKGIQNFKPESIAPAEQAVQTVVHDVENIVHDVQNDLH